MCGIYGAIRLRRESPPIDAAAARRMHLAIEHRGGDGQAVYRDETAFLGLSRLAVVARREPTQVAWDPAKQHVAVMDGAIYNHQALRDAPLPSLSDTAVVPHLLASRGSSFVHELIGEYAIALYTPAKQCLGLVRDRLGIKPLFVAQTPDYLVFASDVAGIVASGLVPVELDSAAAAAAIAHGTLPEGVTLLRDVTVVPPGHRLEVFEGKVTVQRYWSAGAATWEGDVDDLADLVRDAVMLRARAETTIAAALSGGLGATMVTMLARANLARAYTLAMPGAEPEQHGSATCKRMALQHTVVAAQPPTLGAMGNLGADAFGIASVVDTLARAVRNDGHKVVIGGEGAHRLFAAQQRPVPAASDPRIEARLAELAAPARISDRLWMGHGIQARTPFLDHRLVEAVIALAPAASPDDDLQMLRAVAAELVPGFTGPPAVGRVTAQHPAKTDILIWATTTFAEPCVAVDSEAAQRLHASADTDDTALRELWHTLIVERAARSLLRTPPTGR